MATAKRRATSKPRPAAKRGKRAKRSKRVASPPALTLVNATEIARRCNLESERRVQQLVKDEGAPREERGLYDPDRFVAWYIRYLQGCIQRREAERSPGVNAALRVQLAEAALREFKLAQLRGEHVTKAAYRAELERVLQRVAGTLDTAPGKYGPVLPGDASTADKVAAVRAIVREVRAELRTAGATVPAEANAAPSAEPSMPPDPALAHVA